MMLRCVSSIVCLPSYLGPLYGRQQMMGFCIDQMYYMLLSAGFDEKFAGNWRTPWLPSGKAKQKIYLIDQHLSLIHI